MRICSHLLKKFLTEKFIFCALICASKQTENYCEEENKLVFEKCYFFIFFEKVFAICKFFTARCCCCFFGYSIQSPVLLSVAYLTVANLAQLGISVHCLVSVRSQHLARLLSQRWITGGHTIHQPIERLLPPKGIESTPFRNSVSKVAGLQLHAITPG